MATAPPSIQLTMMSRNATTASSGLPQSPDSSIDNQRVIHYHQKATSTHYTRHHQQNNDDGIEAAPVELSQRSASSFFISDVEDDKEEERNLPVAPSTNERPMVLLCDEYDDDKAATAKKAKMTQLQEEFERKYTENGMFTEDELKEARKEILADVKKAVEFADQSPMPPVELAKELEYPDAVDRCLLRMPTPASSVPNKCKPSRPIWIICAKRPRQERLPLGMPSIVAIHEEMPLIQPLPSMPRIYEPDPRTTFPS